MVLEGENAVSPHRNFKTLSLSLASTYRLQQLWSLLLLELGRFSHRLSHTDFPRQPPFHPVRLSQRGLLCETISVGS